VGTCDQPIASDIDSPGLPGRGTLYYGHPGASNASDLPRMNYTLHRSLDGGASWQFVDRIYPGGAGDSHHLITTRTIILPQATPTCIFCPPLGVARCSGWRFSEPSIPLIQTLRAVAIIWPLQRTRWTKRRRNVGRNGAGPEHNFTTGLYSYAYE
jgi:hypothetical protein